MTADRRAVPMLRATAAAACLCTALPVVQAETGPWYVGARQTFTRDSNVYRTPDAISDWISSTGVFGGLDQQISRQRLQANVALDWNRYRDQTQLNHSSGSGLVRLDWETVGNLSGDAQVSHNRNLYRDYLQASDAQRKTVVSTTDGAFNARLGVVTAWTFEAGVFGSRKRYSGAISNASDLDYNGYRAGVRFNPRSHVTVGLYGRRADGEYPNAGESLDFKRDDIDLLFGWTPTGTSTFTGRVSRSKWKYEQVEGRSNSFTTGSLTYLFRPGGRWTMDVFARRDNSAGQYAFEGLSVVGNQLVVTESQSVDNRIVNSYGLSGAYQLTGKTLLSASLQRADRRLDNSITRAIDNSTVLLRGDDRTTSASLQASWDATRAIRVACGISHTKRTVSEGSGQLTYPYSVNLANCSAQIALQP